MPCIAASPAAHLRQSLHCPPLRSSKLHQYQRMHKPILDLAQCGLAYRQKSSITRPLSLTRQQERKLPVLSHSIRGTKRILPKFSAFLKSDDAATCSRAVGGILLPLTIEGPVSERCASHKASRNGFNPDEWLEHCIIEVVRNIQEAPFLHLVFGSKGNRRIEGQRVTCNLFDRSRGCETPREDASWGLLRDTLSKLAPDAVILVQKLNADLLIGDCVASSNDEPHVARGHHRANSLEQPGITDVWGLLFCTETATRSACYILKTTRVSSPAGICTQFCLTRAQCFGPSVREQLERIWLVGS